MNGCSVSLDLEFLSCGASRHEPCLLIQGDVGFCDARSDGLQRHLLPQNESGGLSLSLPLFHLDCRSPADSQYVREELVRPDVPGL
jgi:hypothetical protein